jgi:hypothetical protein
MGLASQVVLWAFLITIRFVRNVIILALLVQDQLNMNV